MGLRSRLPGIRVDTSLPAPPRSGFPRMDVAVFVGIAERGPCHRPVRIESVAAFEAVFGGTTELAFDAQSGSTLTANLAPSVRAFFANEGEECWVIRVAWTSELVEAWEASTSVTPAQTQHFTLSGLLGVHGIAANGRGETVAANIAASSHGAWADGLALSARVLKAPVSITALRKHKWGVRFSTRARLAQGDLLELREEGTGILRYIKIIERDGADYWAAWCKSFRPISETSPRKDGFAHLPGRRVRVRAQFFEGAESRIVLGAEADQLAPGTWVRITHSGSTFWLRADRVQGKEAFGPAWRQGRSQLFSGRRFTATQVTLDLRSELGSLTRIDGRIGLTPEAANSLYDFVSDDAHYADEDRREGISRPLFALPAATGAEIDAFRVAHAPDQSDSDLAAAFVAESAATKQRLIFSEAFLPLGLDASFRPVSVPLAMEAEEPLEQSGLVPFDHRLFIDPAFAGMTTQNIDRHAIQRHDLDEQELFGIHAAYDIPGESVGEASILAVPDAVQPGWTLAEDSADLPEPDPGALAPPNWRDHTGPCPVDTDEELSAPDYAGFLDSDVVVLATPTLGPAGSEIVDDRIRLTFSSSDTDVEFVLEEAARHDFADAAEIYRGTDSELILTGRTDGIYYYRLRTRRAENISPFAAKVVVLRATNFVAAEIDTAETLRIHIAMLRLAAGSAVMTALLSLPRGFKADAAQDHAVNLVTPGVGDTALNDREARSLSYGALFHPWIAGGAQDALITLPPEGAVAGHMATIARERGAWIAPANRDFANALGLYPAIAREDWLDSDNARINLVLPRPDGFSAHAARSLSGEADWQQVNVRRLFIFLRRLLRSVGERFLFEPNGPTVRRSIERTLSNHFDLLQRQGAFSGEVSRDSYFIRLRSTRHDRDNGRILADIGIAPSHPMEFIEVALVQQGERLTLEEAA